MERCKGATQFADLKNVANSVFTSITIDCKRRLRNSQERSLPSHTINKKVHYSSSSLAFGIRMLDIIVLTCRPKISQVLFLFHKLRRSKLLLLLRTNAISISPTSHSSSQRHSSADAGRREMAACGFGSVDTAPTQQTYAARCGGPAKSQPYRENVPVAICRSTWYIMVP